jgi:hypothetical protein
MDAVVQLFSDQAEPNFQMEKVHIELGFKKQRTNKFQLHAKCLGDSYTPCVFSLLGIQVIRTATHVGRHLYCLLIFEWWFATLQFTINSFTNPSLFTYIVVYTPMEMQHKGWIYSCNCPHFACYSSGCKHMYYLAARNKMLVTKNTGAAAQNYLNGPTDSNVEVVPHPPPKLARIHRAPGRWEQ